MNRSQEDWKIDMQESMDFCYEQEKLQFKKDQRTLHKQKRKLSKFLFKELVDIIDFYESTWDYKIVKTLGESASKEIDNYHKLRHLFTDIESMGWPSGDYTSGGDVWVPIKNGNYFKFSFSM